MKNKILVVVDMQNDFVGGTLRNEDGINMVPTLVKKVADAKANGDIIIYTQDTHGENYMETQEGKNLPVPHCIKGTKGWEIIDELKPYVDGTAYGIFEKPTFGCTALATFIKKYCENNVNAEIELVGLCTDICVVSNALLIKATVPEVPVAVDATCCAGVTRETHDAALTTMKTCQIKVNNEGKELWKN
jgi:nicotinamidase-related amidase